MANFNRRHYIAVAEVLRVHRHRAEVQTHHYDDKTLDTLIRSSVVGELGSMAEEFADTFARDNSQFNREHFLAVVRGENDLNFRPSKK